MWLLRKFVNYLLSISNLAIFSSFETSRLFSVCGVRWNEKSVWKICYFFNTVSIVENMESTPGNVSNRLCALNNIGIENSSSRFSWFLLLWHESSSQVQGHCPMNWRIFHTKIRNISTTLMAWWEVDMKMILLLVNALNFSLWKPVKLHYAVNHSFFTFHCSTSNIVCFVYM